VFDAAGDQHVAEAAPNLPGGDVDGLLSGATHPVELHARHPVVPPDDHRRESTDVRSLLPDRADTATDNVLDDGGVQIVAPLQRHQWLGGEVLRVGVP
jgi:hypothetical protein